MSASFLDVSTQPSVANRELGRGTDERLTRKASLNAVASLLDYFTKVAVGLVITPILVGGLGSSVFGIWEMLGRLIGYMSVTDGRPTEALRLVISNQQAIDDPALKRRYVGSALGIWVLFLPIFAAAGAVLVWLSPTLTKVSNESYYTVRVTSALLIISCLLANLAALPESVLRGMNLGYRRMGLQAGLNVVGAMAVAGAVYFGLGLIGIAGAQVLLSGITGLLFLLVVRKYVSWFGVAKPGRSEMRRLLRVSVWNSMGNLIAKLHLASDVIILGVIASSATVTTYVLTGYSAQAVIGIITLTLGAASPGLGGLIGQKQYAKTAALRQEIMAMNWLLVTAIGSTILLWNKSFLHLWVGGEYYAGTWVNLLSVLIMAQTVFIRSDAYVIDAALQLRGRVLVSALAGILSIAFCLVLTRFFGILGLCLGILAGRMTQTVWYPFMANACLDRSRGIRLHGLVRPGLAMCLLFGSSSYVGQRLLARNWIEWAGCVGASLAVLLCIALVAGLSTDSRQPLVKRLTLICLSINSQLRR